MDFGGRHIVVTGGSSGIGRAAAKLLAERGAKVTLIARNADKLAAVTMEIGDSARYAVADIADKAALRAALDDAEAGFGPIEGLFANAGVGGHFASILDYRDEDFDALIAANMTSLFHALQRVLPGMYVRGRGSIVATGSLASARGMANNVGYVASKHGLLGITRAVALEAAPRGVRVNCLIPGFIDTALMAELPPGAAEQLAGWVPQGRMGTGEEAAEVAVFLLSDAAAHVTGQSWAVDGGILGTLKLG